MGLINAYKPQLGISTCVCVCVCVCVYAFIAFCGYCNKTYFGNIDFDGPLFRHTLSKFATTSPVNRVLVVFYFSLTDISDYNFAPNPKLKVCNNFASSFALFASNQHQSLMWFR